ncbi:hypothetical protein CKM354_001161600 [Cercospora kikuchii]|uniref:Uncharacterized protein n=1 Tax=Cercospora kikuchii TaxID=84275 RepID=A0A9P3CVU2_9PEZI|nr:uncharacterized protein CKM354_001161600 [Cercospora kikuchii]GIZ48562.1 hypothetical protein CKM354_001161600 [Cercospora kikuchii]
MGDDLAFISYSTERHVDAGTLSRIRSHAQQSVQDQKWSKKAKKAKRDASENAAKDAANRPSRPEFLQLIFDKKSGKEVKRPNTTRNQSTKSVARRKKAQDEIERRVVKRESHSLSASPAERPDPFAAFPVEIDERFMNLFYGYSRSWKWQNQDHTYLFKETMWSPVLAHSFLAIANHVWAQDEARSILHEDQTMMHISQQLPQLDRLAPEARSEMACALMWSIIRLATMKVNSGQLDESMMHLNALALIDREDWEHSKFAPHYQSAMASLLLANFHQAGKVKPLLHMPFGSMATNAVDDVEADGYEVPDAALMLQWEISGFVPPRVTDALLGLTALYNICGAESGTKDESVPHMHSGQKASQAVKIALRLARYSTPASSPADAGYDWIADFQECVRLTGLLWTWTFGRKVLQNTEAIVSTQKHISATLTPALLRKVLDECGNTKAMSDLLVWMLIVCGSATSSIRGRQEYANLVRAILPGATNTSYGQIRLLGTKLPWIELSSDSPTEDFWHLVCSESSVVEVDDTPEEDSNAAPPLLGYATLVSRSRNSPPENG